MQKTPQAATLRKVSMEYPKEWDEYWVSNEEYLRLTGTMLIGALPAYNSKGEFGMRLKFHPKDWKPDERV